MTHGEYNMPIGKRQMSETFSDRGIQYPWTQSIAAKSCIIKLKYSQEQYLVSQSHNIEYTIIVPKLIE